MLKNYLTLAFRNLVGRPQFAIINISGLSIGMAACFILLQVAIFEGSYDKFNLHADRIFRLSLRLTAPTGNVTEVPKNFSALAPKLKSDFPEVKDFVRLFPIDGTMAIKSGDKTFNESKIMFADPSVFSVFTFPLISGEASTALTLPNTVVLTKSTAERYFGNVNPVGNLITMREGKMDVALTVTGVAEDVPENSHFSFDILISHATLSALWGERADNSWDEALFYSYVLLAPEADEQAWQKKLNGELLKDYTHWNSSLKLELVTQPLRDIYLNSHMVQEAKSNGNARQVTVLWLVAMMIVLLSWINYVNISTARYAERAKEVGVRKIIGASKLNLLIQFMLESLIMSLMGVFIACALIQISVPFISNFTGKNIPMWESPKVLLETFVFFIGGSILASTFPSLILSSLNALQVIKGKLHSTSSGISFRKGLITFQFLSSALIVGIAFVVYLQLNYMRHADIGADLSAILVVPTPNVTDTSYTSRSNFFKKQITKVNDIAWVVSSTSIPGKDDNIVSGGLARFESADEDGANHYAFGVDRQFVEAYGMKVVAGRNFSQVGDENSVIINETAMRTLGFEDASSAIGRKIVANWQEQATIIGVISDFHQHSLKSAIVPVVLYLDEQNDFGYFSIKISANQGKFSDNIEMIRREWERAFPGNPFDYFFLDKYFERQYQDDIRFGRIMIVFSTLGVIIACLGIFGLSVFTASQRTKEISIRKVLGASMANILSLLTVDYLKLIGLALAISIPISYFLALEWLREYAFHIEIRWWMLIIPGIAIASVALLTITSQTWAAAVSDPTKNLNE